MTTRCQTRVGLTAFLAATIVFIIQHNMRNRDTAENTSVRNFHPPDRIEKRDLTNREPRAGFDQALEVMARGGTGLEIGDATGFLDELTRSGVVLESDRRAKLLGALERGTPKGMSEGNWSHLFNNACNVLAVRQTAADERLLKLLENTASNDPRLVMRLYALQHLGVSYDHADAETCKRLRLLVRQMLTEPEVQTAGTALVLLRKWEKSMDANEDPSTEISRVIVIDSTRPVDVRVTALHAIGDDPKVIDLARGIAPDSSQPIILRKVAISLIGQHGEATDLPVLRQYGQESPRLAQASSPAVHMLEERLSGKTRPVVVPY